MKFVLGFVAITLISLTIYITMESNGKQHVQKEVSKAVQPQKQVFEVVPAKVTPKKVTHLKVDTPKHEVTSMKEVVPSAHSSTAMNDELATDEEYTPNVNQTSDEPISDKEWNAVEKQMIESGQISQEDDASASTENLGYDPSELAGKI